MLILAGLLIGVLVPLFFGEKATIGRRKKAKPIARKTCPLCGSFLEKGENIHTVVYGKKAEQRAGMPADRIAHIFGCPHCYSTGSRIPRICPVCKKQLPKDGYIIARMFETTEKRHVHVLGCTNCRNR